MTNFSHKTTAANPAYPAVFGDGMVCENQAELDAYLNGIDSAGDQSQAVGNQQPLMSVRPDMIFVIGIQDEMTDLAAKLCEEVGLRVHFAMKKSDPSKRINSLQEDAVIVPPLPEGEHVLICGLKASERLSDVEGGPLDCNWTTSDAYAFAVPLLAFLHAPVELLRPLPAGWSLRDISVDPSNKESALLDCQVGHFGLSGAVVADFGNSKQLLQLPETYCSIFPQLENKFF